MIKKLLGLAPQLEEDGSYRPSKLALKLATSPITDYESLDYQKYQGTKNKILVLCSEEKNMTMQNGKQFSTGNHPVEMLLPMLHLHKAGFEFEIVTPTGKPVILEMWAFPNEDTEVKKLYSLFKDQLENPKKLHDVVDTIQDQADSYAAIFVPWGHGAMLWIPQHSDKEQDMQIQAQFSCRHQLCEAWASPFQANNESENTT